MTTQINLPPMVAHPDPHALNWSKAELRALKAYATAAILADRAAQPAYDQTALELCITCGWKTLIPGDCCLNCERFKSISQPASTKEAT